MKHDLIDYFAGLILRKSIEGSPIQREGWGRVRPGCQKRISRKMPEGDFVVFCSTIETGSCARATPVAQCSPGNCPGLERKG